jgi:hypothetical protein
MFAEMIPTGLGESSAHGLVVHRYSSRSQGCAIRSPVRMARADPQCAVFVESTQSGLASIAQIAARRSFIWRKTGNTRGV